MGKNIEFYRQMMKETVIHWIATFTDLSLNDAVVLLEDVPHEDVETLAETLVSLNEQCYGWLDEQWAT